MKLERHTDRDLCLLRGCTDLARERDFPGILALDSRLRRLVELVDGLCRRGRTPVPAAAAAAARAGSTWSTSNAAPSAIRRPMQQGQQPRDLQENGTRSSSPQLRQQVRTKPSSKSPLCGAPHNGDYAEPEIMRSLWADLAVDVHLDLL